MAQHQNVSSIECYNIEGILLMKSFFKLIQEQIDNFYLVRRLSMYDLVSSNKNNYLGILWELLNPMTQILIYWFVFGTLRSRAPVEVAGEEIPFIIWLIVGFLVWIFFYQASIGASKSIYSRLRMLSKMNFPLSVIPNVAIFSKLYIHIGMLGIAFIIYQFAGYYVSIYFVQIIYFIFCLYAFTFAFGLIMSTLSTIVRDVHLFLNSTLRMGLYVSGVLWPLSILADFPKIHALLKFNPLIYVIDGYRYSFLGSGWYIVEHWKYGLYFWAVVLIMLLIGSVLHMKFRRNFIDYL